MSSHATGPRSAAGKERSAVNAIKHGLRSERTVVPGEDAEEWDEFRNNVVGDLRTGNTIERELAEVSALQLWRLRRAARYEADVARARHERGFNDLNSLLTGLSNDHPTVTEVRNTLERIKTEGAELAEVRRALDCLRQLPGLAAETPVAPETAERVLDYVETSAENRSIPATADELRRELAQRSGLSAEAAAAQILADVGEDERFLKESLAEGGSRVGDCLGELQRQCQERQDDQRLLQRTELDRVVRYEAHVGRQLMRAMELLERLKKARGESTEPKPAPVEPVEAPPAPPCPAPADAVRPDAIQPSSFGNSAHPTPPRADTRQMPDQASSPLSVEEFVRQFLDDVPNGGARGADIPVCHCSGRQECLPHESGAGQR